MIEARWYLYRVVLDISPVFQDIGAPATATPAPTPDAVKAVQEAL